MAVPKNFRKDLKYETQLEGYDQRQHLLDNIAENQGYLPQGIAYEDMDRQFIDFVKTELEIVVEGQKVPVYIVSIQRWYEFYTTWENSDEFGNITLPFIVITRKIDVQKGTTHGNNYNIPGFLTWGYMKVPTTDGNRDGYDIYKIPQPIAVDVQYEVRFFTNKIRSLNVLNSKIQRAFSARQCYLNVNGHPMPLTLESIGDESQTDNLEQRKYYVQPYTIKLMGYLLNAEDFQVVPAVNRTILFTEIEEGKQMPTTKAFEGIYGQKKDITINFTFVDETLTYTATILNKSEYNNIVINNVNSYTYLLNGAPISLPFTVNQGDQLNVTINSKNNNILPCSVIFMGTTI
jgi:hypothetical protein